MVIAGVAAPVLKVRWVCWANWAVRLNKGSQAGEERKRGAGEVGMAGSEDICGFTGHPAIDRVAATHYNLQGEETPVERLAGKAERVPFLQAAPTSAAPVAR